MVGHWFGGSEPAELRTFRWGVLIGKMGQAMVAGASSTANLMFAVGTMPFLVPLEQSGIVSMPA